MSGEDLSSIISGLEAEFSTIFEVLSSRSPVLSGPVGATGSTGNTGSAGPAGPAGVFGPLPLITYSLSKNQSIHPGIINTIVFDAFDTENSTGGYLNRYIDATYNPITGILTNTSQLYLSYFITLIKRM